MSHHDITRTCCGTLPNTAKARTELTLVCLPPAGGSADFFAPLVPDLHRRGVALLGLELPGRGRRRAERPVTSMDELLDRLLPVMRSVPRPYALLGHSMGAFVAFTAAARLQDECRDDGPAAVVASAMVAPPGPEPTGGRQGAVTERQLNGRADDDVLLGQLVRCGGLPELVLTNHHARRLFLPPLRADLRLLEDGMSGRARPTRPLDRPVLALSGASDEVAPPRLVAGWSRWTTTGFAHHLFAGGHSFLTQDPGLTAQRLVQGLGLLGLSGLAA